MSGKTIAESLEYNLANRILLTLHIADRRGYGMSLVHISNMLIYGEAEEEEVRLMLSSMPNVSHLDDIYCLKGSESFAFSSSYASLCPFIKCIAVAGSMASGGFSGDDDIDFNIFHSADANIPCIL